jgi:hypothetical protein
MKRRLILAAVFIGVIFQNCIAQDFDEDIVKVKKTTSLYIELEQDHYVDKAWRKTNLNKIFHPNLNYIGAQHEYSSIIDKLNKLDGTFLFLSAEIDSIAKGKAWIDYTKSQSSEELAYFVKISYLVIAIIKNAALEIPDVPQKIEEYIVLGLDKVDNEYKVIDTYPSLKNREFIGVKYYIDNYDKLSRSIEYKEKLTKAYETIINNSSATGRY